MAKSIFKWIDHRLPVFTFFKKHLLDYSTPRNLSFLWSTGFLSGIILMMMIITGIFLAMHYDPDPRNAFASIEHIMRDVNYGWLIRYIHMNGASFFFLIVYLHIFRGLYYGSYKSPRELLWILGVLIFLIMMATAFMGYVLPWGQMSYWAATVITNLFSAIPLVGESALHWILGGPTVGAATLHRFCVLHYLLPFAIVGVVILHLIALHQFGSNNPLGITTKHSDEIPFHPYYTIKDLLVMGIFFLIFSLVIFFAPNLLGEADNYIPANPLSTPTHIVPEWYFLPFYAMLRSVPNKLGGVLVLFSSASILFFVPWLDRSPIRSAMFRPLYRPLFWLFVLDCIILGWAGSKPPMGHYLIISRCATLYYFLHFLVIMPFLPRFEKTPQLPDSVLAFLQAQHRKKKSK
jgi:quinol-cytochrome oxidoreductase complex cytochrome b subunit